MAMNNHKTEQISEAMQKDDGALTENTSRTPVKAKRKKFRRFLLLPLVLVVVMAAAVVSTMEDGHHFSTLRRWLMYGETAQTQDLYSYTSHQENRCVQFGEDLLVVNPNTITLVQQGGFLLCELSVDMAAPVISVGSELAAVCDAGGSSVYVLDHAGLRYIHTAESGLLCYSARLNARDQLTVTEQKSGYKASVSVYDPAGEMIFRFDSHENYLSDATVTDDGKTLVVISIAAQSGAFTSSLVVYDLATAQRTAAHPLRDGLVLDLTLNGPHIITLCDKRLVITTLNGETYLNHTYGELYLHDYALTGSDFCALLLGRYQSSNICQIATFGVDGLPLATLDLTEEVIDLSAAGDHLAVLYSDSLVIYDRTLTEQYRLEGTDYARNICANRDGTVLLIAETSAWRFLP